MIVSVEGEGRSTAWAARPGPISSVKTRNGRPSGPLVGRNFDAGARFWGQKKSKCEEKPKTIKITQWIDQKCMLRFFFFFEIMGPLIFARCFLLSAARSFLGPHAPFLGQGKSKFRFRICVTRHQVLPCVVCLLWCRRCLWRVPWSQMTCY